MDETMLLIAGTIGAGKSSLTDMLSQEMNSKPFYENVDDNEVLPLFYSNPEKYTFLLQVFFLNKRFLAMKDALPQADNVLDRSIYEDSLLFHLNADLGRVSSEEVKQYDNLLDTMLKELEQIAPKKRPDLLVHIKVSFDVMLERIEKRGRDYEQIATNPELYEYYKLVNERYEKWFDSFTICPKIQIDGDRYDFVADPKAAEIVINQIKEETNKLNVSTFKNASYYSSEKMEKGIF
ncbi:deoxyadenosine kinase [Enterococcus sp. HMSC29A04]|uniref:deoxynucleoside kinase n=1 Tax=Enterococcus TaxID=1350 RepID=UPI0003F56097|nr:MULTISPECIES: deoxynucleoside kinase [Enterococcus]SBA18609.1 deoxynucleoside kinase [Enterococcus faecium]MDT2571151.1 deoxynucleoside kinase [Enterococcus raffinosus]OFT82843.1 deoxyadenosine kinase [Enterococcus sp. HMSC29A04]OFU62812.1 deoxyadenosine kinase [Enterococcus sp. HMSC14A10]QXJ61401.1 deoxynucleoside kinase [Enterococcus raffinosus]